MRFVFNDGGRAAAGHSGRAGDCVARAIAIATGKPYQEVFDALDSLAFQERIGRRKKKRSNSDSGVFRSTYQRYLDSLGWQWTSTMSIGSGCRVQWPQLASLNYREASRGAAMDHRIDPSLAVEAKAISALAFRNGLIEDLHAGKTCPACSGNPEFSHVSDEEMKRIMKAAVNAMYRLL